MKKKIHPEYKDTLVTCACGEAFKTKSTIHDIKLDICSKCHPFFTGKQKLIDAAGRVDRFKKRFKDVSPKKAGKQEAQPAAAPQTEPQAEPQPEQNPAAEAKE